MLFTLFKRFLFAAIAVPVAAFGARKLGDAIEKRRGPNRGSQVLRSGANTLQDRFGRQSQRRQRTPGR